MPNKPPQKSSRNEIFPHFSSHNQFFTLTLQPNKNKTMKNIFKSKKKKDSCTSFDAGIRKLECRADPFLSC